MILIYSNLKNYSLDILIEKRKDHKIVLLDATPLPLIVDRIKAKVDNFKEIRVDEFIQ